MVYQKISEYISKKMYDLNYPILKLDKISSSKYYINNQVDQVDNFLKKYENAILKVDQFVKRRGKKGLVKVVTKVDEVEEFIKEKDYDSFVLEPKYEILKEYYLCLKQVDNGIEYIFNKDGGIHLLDPYENGIISNNKEKFLKESLSHIDNNHHDSFTEVVEKLVNIFNNNFGNLLEVNPLCLLKANNESFFLPIDFAFQIDSTSSSFLSKETQELLTVNSVAKKSKIKVEEDISNLDEKTGASLKFTVLNKNGKIWTLVAGGGASVLFTDAISRLGYSNELANYGEYSGNPTSDEVYNYCTLIFNYLGNQEKDFTSGLDHVKLYIGGGVSNFTDVGQTFKGIIKAIEQNETLLKDNRIRVYVRRGGVNEAQGLKSLKETLDRLNIPNIIYGSDEFITKIVSDTLDNKEKNNNSSFESKFIKEADNLNYQLSNFNIWNENILFYGMHQAVIQRMIDFDYHVGKKETNVKYIINPFSKGEKFASFFFGSEFINIPVLTDLDKFPNLVNENDIYTAINFSSHRSAYNTTLKLLDVKNIQAITIIAEGIPEKLAIELKKIASKKDKTILGPSSVGAIKSGFQKLGNVCGKMDNIIKCQLGSKGNVGLITKSGGLLNDMIRWLSGKNLFVNQAIAIGGDRFPCTRFADILNYYHNNSEIDYVIIIGEEGGTNELELVKLKEDLNITKPIFAWCSGISSDFFNREIEFGHAGASASCQIEKANFKNYYMRKNGFLVPESFEELPNLIFKNLINPKQTLNNLLKDVPLDLNDAIKENKVRINPEIISSISDERGNLFYRDVNINTVLKNENSLGYTIGLLWFNIKLDKWATEYLEKILSVMADHGPAVSGATNTIICSRAGKNLVESLSSGLLTIGPRFGGAISDAANIFYENCRNNIEPNELVNIFKKNNKYLPGIGHKVKSIHNPDHRVIFLKEYILENFPNKEVTNYSINVETVTTKKKGNLILNVDGIIGASLVDLLSYYLPQDQILNILNTDILNGFFCLSRSIGLVGHYHDQKQQKSVLYRTPNYIIKYGKK